ncbi:MAG: GAF domain-containing protein [Nitrospirae bacterium]|nr:GAF domain-containing protein [Candidatus Manganitrophaceae bacterium]
MSDELPQGSLPQESVSEDTEKNHTETLDEASSALYDKLDPVLALFSDLPERTLHSDRILEQLLSKIRTVMQPDLMLFFKWEEADQEWALFFQHGLPEHFIKKGKLSRAWQSLPTIIRHEASPVYSDDISKDRRFIGQVIRSMGVKSFSGHSLYTASQLLGSISIGFFDAEALKKSDQNAFDMVARLLLPFLLTPENPGIPTTITTATPTPTPTPKTKTKTAPNPAQTTAPSQEGMTLHLKLDLAGRIQDCNDAFLEHFASRSEDLKNRALSRLLTKKSNSIYAATVKKLKTSESGTASITLELLKKGGPRRLLSVELKLEKPENGSKTILFKARDITKIEPLETELAYKNSMQTIWTTLSSGLQELAKKMIENTSSHNIKHDVDEDQILGEALKKAFVQLGFEGGCLLRLQPRGKKLVLVAEKGLSEAQLAQIKKHGIGAKEHLLWKTIDKGGVTLLTAKTQKSHLKKRLFGEETLVSFMGLAIECDAHPWGALVFFSRTTLFAETHSHALSLFGKDLGRAVEQIQAFHGLQKRIATLEILNETGQSVTKSLHLPQLLSSVTNTMKNLIDASHCYIFLEDGRRHLYYGAGSSDQGNEAIRKFEIKMNENHLVPLAARERHPFVVENASQDSRVGKKWVKTLKSRSLFTVPLINKDRVVGVLLLDETRYFRKFTTEEVERTAEMAGQIAIGIENAIIHHSVSQHRERLQTLSSAIVNVQEEERRRIAKKLRNDSSAALTKIQEDLTWLNANLADPTPEMKRHLERAKSETNKTLETLKGLSAELRPAILDDSGLIATVKWVVKDFEAQTKTKVHLQITGTIKRMPARIEILLFRVIQESLANVASHAKAESAIVSLEKRDPHIHLYITDDGKGFDVKRYFSSPQMMRKEIGILGMKERVELAGGTFYIDSHPGQGTRISVRVPLVRRNP